MQGNNTDEKEALNFLLAYDREASAMCNNVMNTQWDFNTNITESTKQRMVSPYSLNSIFHRRTTDVLIKLREIANLKNYNCSVTS